MCTYWGQIFTGAGQINAPAVEAKKKVGTVLSFKRTTFILQGQHFDPQEKNIQPSHILWFPTNKPVSFVITGKTLPHSKYLDHSCFISSVSLVIVSRKRYSSGFAMKTHITWFRIIGPLQEKHGNLSQLALTAALELGWPCLCCPR